MLVGSGILNLGRNTRLFLCGPWRCCLWSAEVYRLS